MTNRRTASGLFSRLALLILLALGVGSMHTLGHPTQMEHPFGVTHVMPGTVHQDHHLPAAGSAPGAFSSGDLPAHVPSGALDPLSVCVAILLALTVLASLALHRQAHSITANAAVFGRWRRPLARHGRPRYGLLLSRLSVMRM
ncbi:hypothetical protein [Planomonospora parontospora]|uniref:hypothetical protein n=1 Tax=Planomonospora parontospora TaxID=58119 RepID=UPI0016712420|nr:hypothetical protein [Planomonospora parontospora]GGL59221.1 hypothetical protein GCM10014719_70780 [Planomonospora parontospora subsp. antibiotica]GII20299.1 hypothetical protein Ppa05_70250 [Planomonospora parontospora subsp. antibiotica]